MLDVDAAKWFVGSFEGVEAAVLVDECRDDWAWRSGWNYGDVSDDDWRRRCLMDGRNEKLGKVSRDLRFGTRTSTSTGAAIAAVARAMMVTRAWENCMLTV